MPTDLEFRVTIRDQRTLGFVFRRGGAKAHLVRTAGGVRDLRAQCGRALHETEEHEVFVLSDEWWLSPDVCARCVQRAQEQRLVILTPYTEAERWSERRQASMLVSQALQRAFPLPQQTEDGEDNQP